jgi:hypothetical protein
LFRTCREQILTGLVFIIISQGFKAGVIDESHCHYMVVFQYGSIVLFNVSDHEADGYLKIVEKHASGLLPEMRKDGKPKNTCPQGVEFLILLSALDVIIVSLH